MTARAARPAPLLRMLAALALACLALPVAAHETTRSYLAVLRDGPAVTARLSLAFRDLDPLVWVDGDLDGRVTWAEVQARLPAIRAAATGALTLSAGGPCPLSAEAEGVAHLGGQDYLELRLAARCPGDAGPLEIASTLFAAIDPDHRTFLSVLDAGQMRTTVLPATGTPARIEASGPAAPAVVLNALATGAGHFAGGLDHALFVLVLLLPVLAGPLTAGALARGVLGPVTGFTLGHALSLTVATLGLALPRPEAVTAAILATVMLTALDNLWPFLPGPRSLLAAGFGLVHGFGFAAALGGLPLDAPTLALAILGFNLGVEAAQLAAVAVVLPALAVLGAPRAVLRLGSAGALAAAAILLTAEVGLAERWLS